MVPLASAVNWAQVFREGRVTGTQVCISWACCCGRVEEGTGHKGTGSQVSAGPAVLGQPGWAGPRDGPSGAQTLKKTSLRPGLVSPLPASRDVEVPAAQHCPLPPTSLQLGTAQAQSRPGLCLLPPGTSRAAWSQVRMCPNLASRCLPQSSPRSPVLPP